MKNAYKFYLKNGSPSLLLVGTTCLASLGRTDMVRWRMVSIGLVLIIISVLLIYFRLRRFKTLYGIHELTDEDLRINQTRRYRSDLTRDQLYQKLKADSWFARQSVMKDDGSILIRTRWTFWKLGSETIRISPDEPLEATHTFTVKSSSPQGVLMDYGQSWENVLRVKKILNQA